MNCKHCGKNEDSLSTIGLCDRCDDTIKINVKILRKLTDVLNESKEIRVVINMSKSTLEVLEKLKEYEHLNFIDPSPSQLIIDVFEKRSATVFEYWKNHCWELLLKLESYQSIDEIVHTIEETKKEFVKYQEYIQEYDKIKEIYQSLKSLIDDHVIGKYNKLVYEANESIKELAIPKLNEALNIFQKYKNYFGEANQNLDMELKGMLKEWENGKAWLENHKDWGKEYYEDGSLKAEWSNKDYMKCGDYIKYHRNGNIEMKCEYLDGVNRDGLMHKYFEDGKLKESWSYNKGKRVFVRKYFGNGELKTEWLYDENGNEISKKYYDKLGYLIKK